MTETSVVGGAGDPYGPRLVAGLSGILEEFNLRGVLDAADIHPATRLCRLAGEEHDEVVLAVALAVRAARSGHARFDLAAVEEMDVLDDEGSAADLSELDWPPLDRWRELVAASPLTGAAGEYTPLHLRGTHVYLHQYLVAEQEVAGALTRRAEADAFGSGSGGNGGVLAEKNLSDQDGAVATALAGLLTVIVGGPGTGKTTTVARFLARLFENAARDGQPFPLVALAAPTGKAAARMEEAVRGAAAVDTDDAVRAKLASLNGSTIHRLLGVGARGGRPRYHRGQRLPHDVVVVDEASMVSLSLMADLLAAVRDDARLVLVGDPEQLESVEVGAVLADIVGPAAADPPRTGPMAAGPSQVGPIAASICLLRHNHRFGGVIADLAAAVRDGDADRAVAVLAGAGVVSGAGGRDGPAGEATDDAPIRWVAEDAGDVVAGRTEAARSAAAGLRAATVSWAADLREAALTDPTEALRVLRRWRVLCAHRRGGSGVGVWNALAERWVLESRGPGDKVPGPDPAARSWSWYPGQPLMVTANDHSIPLYNGDGGVVVAAQGTDLLGGDDPYRLEVAFDRGSAAPRLISPYRLASVETVYAMTVHKSQGSEFDEVTLLLPPAGSRLLTRQLVYTAVTRARRRVTVVGTEEAFRAAVETPIARASGLAEWLWPAGGETPGSAGRSSP